MTSTNISFEARRFRPFSIDRLDGIPGIERISPEQRFEMEVVASVLPFRVNEYVAQELIDWERVPDDPIYQLTFPQRGMLAERDFERMASLHRRSAPTEEIQALAAQLRAGLNPHPAGQQELNVPLLGDERMRGLQHKYAETVLFFPSQGQTCHSYCTFCFRWAQFIGDAELKFADDDASKLHRYLEQHGEVTDLLVTGGDPMVMKTRVLERYLRPLLTPELEHVQDIRIGTKALSFWPYRFVTDKDADDLLRLFEELVAAGKHVAIMAHYEHWQEMEPAIAHEAIRRIRDTGAVIRSQAPLLAHINDSADVWARLWRTQVRHGIVPYYMFVERDTGARRYFEVPLGRAWKIYKGAIRQVPGLARTARGPSMSAGPGKVEVQGVARIHGEKVFVLRFIQGRDPSWVQRPFFAKYDPKATWLNHLRPAFGEPRFFYEDEFDSMSAETLEQIEMAGEFPNNEEWNPADPASPLWQE